MNVIHSVEDNNSQIIHVSVNSNDRGATGEKGDSVVDVKITETNRLETTLSNGQTIDGGAVPAIKTRRVFVADMDGVKRTYILPLDIEASQVSYILMNGVAYSDGYVLQSGEITLNYDDLPAGRLEVVLNDNSGSGGTSNTSVNGKAGDIHLKTINGANLDGDGDIELATLGAFNNEVRTREETDNNLRNSLSDHEARISNNESVISSHSNNLSSLNANISSVNNQMTVLANDVHGVTDNYVPKTRRINDKFLSHDIRLTADDVEALPITAGVTHPVRGELVVNGHITAENATQDNHVVTKAQLDAKVAEVVNSAPETLDTLEELAKSLGDDPNFATTVTNKIGTVDKKIDTEINKLANKVEVNTEDLKNTTQKANANSTNISLINSTIATNKLSSDTQFSNVAKEQDEQNNLISDILNAFSKESEKGTNLKLNTSATKMLSMTFYGNTEQVKTSGKNLVYNVTSKTALNGLKHTVNPDGSIATTGTPNNTYSYITDPTPGLLIKKGETVTLSVDKPLPFDLFIGGSEDSGYSNLGIQLPAGQLQVTVQAQTTKFVNCLIAGRMTAGKAITPITYKAQLEYGGTATEFSYYTGGFNNLFDEFSELPVNKNGLKLEDVNGILKFTGMPTTDWNTMISRDITAILSDKTDYTVVQYNTHGHKLYPAIVAYKADGSGGDETNAINSKTFSFRVDKTKYNRYVMKLQVATRASFSEPVTIYNNYALFQGNYDENNLTEYSPYSTGLASPRPQYPQVVKGLTNGEVEVISKNFAILENKNYTNTDLAVRVNADGSITVQGENKNFWGMNITTNKFVGIPLKKGDVVTLSIDKPLPYTIKWYAMRDDNTAIDNFCNILAGETSKTATIPANLLYGRLFFNIQQVGLQVPPTTFKVQLEYGDAATEFIPRESSEFTIPTGLNIYKLTDTVYDEIKLENGIAKLIKRVGKLELSGEENNIYSYKTRVDGSLGFQWKNPSGEFLFTQQQDIATIVSSHFNVLREPDAIGNNNLSSGIGLFKTGDSPYPRYTTNITIWLSLTDMQNLKITDLASFKNWLKAEKAKGTPVTVYYEMKTPTEEKITDQAVLAELKKLMEMRTYDGTTNISITGTDLTPDIKVKYMRKIGE
nr:MAG TPA: Baseplate wedge protein [Caudoviricetes sp.]